MAGASEYQELVKQAEAAVQSVKDPELKRVAFEKILSDLLGGDQLTAPPTKPSSKLGKKTTLSAKKRKKPRGPRGYVEELVDDGFFKKPKTIAEVKAELENRGHHIPLTSLSGPLQTLCQNRTLRRQRRKTTGKKETFIYSEW